MLHGKKRSSIASRKNPVRFVIITGLSGAGKNLAIRCFEDLGFFCVDNLPTIFIPKFAQFMIKGGDCKSRATIVVDVRERSLFDNLFKSLEDLEKIGVRYNILFLEASDEHLLNRYKETRRPHPLRYGTIIEDIRSERKKLEKIRGRADMIIDTSSLTPQEFRNILIKEYMDVSSLKMKVNVVSFGYKYGLPHDADLVFDVRFLPNPHYVKSLEPYTGEDKRVKDYVLKWPVTKQFIDKISNLIDFLLPKYTKEGKAYLMIAFGCTGGRHRSVVIANEIRMRLSKNGYKANIYHRDAKKR